MVDTVDDAFEIEGLNKEEVFRNTCDNYRQCLSWAEDYGIIINVEPHGPYTTDGDFTEQLFSHFESEYPSFGWIRAQIYAFGFFLEKTSAKALTSR